MNLLQDRWLPVLTKDGGHALAALADLGNPDIVAFDAPRADFNGGLTQFVVAVLQMAMPARSTTHWRQRLTEAPTEASLQALLAPHAEHFQLDGNGVRFMQDFELRNTNEEPTPIAGLLMETPGENALKNNTDVFIKRHQVRALCPACAAMALFTLQTNAPAGGAGHRTGLRGGGPLTTLVTARATHGQPLGLWTSLWLNVLPQPAFEALNGDTSLDQVWHRLPWVAPIGRLQPEKGETQPSQVHPQHVLWATPRRLRLDFEQRQVGRCDLCHQYSDQLLVQYVTRNYGLNYKGPWRHPHSPYYGVKGEWLPMHPQPGGIGYRHWLGLVLGSSNDKKQIEAATAVSMVLGDTQVQRQLAREGLAWQLWCFGHDMDNMKARCWYEASLPLYQLADCEPATRQQLAEQVRDWVEAADLAASLLRRAVKNAWFGGDAKGDFSHVDAAFWSGTAPMFYRTLQTTMARLRQQAHGEDGSAADQATRERWFKHLCHRVLALFEDDFVGAGPIEQQNMARVASAHRELRRGLYGGKLHEAMGLPKPVREKAAKTPRAPPQATTGGKGRRPTQPANTPPSTPPGASA
jgi:CRISPR system Cascade subunit CasA